MATTGASWTRAGIWGVGRVGPSGSSPSGIGGRPGTGAGAGVVRSARGGGSGGTGGGGSALASWTSALRPADTRGTAAACGAGVAGALNRALSVTAGFARAARLVARAGVGVAVPSGLAAGGVCGRGPESGRGPAVVGDSCAGGGDWTVAAGARGPGGAGAAPALDPGAADPEPSGAERVRSAQATSRWPPGEPGNGTTIRRRSSASAA
jgi:hypothetical protein